MVNIDHILNRIYLRYGLDPIGVEPVNLTLNKFGFYEINGVDERMFVAQVYHNALVSLRRNVNRHYILKGGRGSGKSSFCAMMCVIHLLANPDHNVIAIRRYDKHLQDSVKANFEWVIDTIFQMSDKFKFYKNKLKIVYKPTGQEILFRGCDDPDKIKSIKTARGRIGACWFEELTDFKQESDIRSIIFSVNRGTTETVYSNDNETYVEKVENEEKENGTVFFYSYNPPYDLNHWVNRDFNLRQDGYIYIHSTYLDVPKRWLGADVLKYINDLKERNNRAFRVEIMGEAIGCGLNVFQNIEERALSDEQIARLPGRYRGLDWGYIDPTCFIQCSYDLNAKELYIWDEIYESKISTENMIDKLTERKVDTLVGSTGWIYADNSDNRENRKIYESGFTNLRSVSKGSGSVNFGLRFLSLSCNKIIIDSKRCPNAYREFKEYSLVIDKNGQIDYNPPDKSNHSIDSVRYALTDVIKLSKGV